MLKICLRRMRCLCIVLALPFAGMASGRIGRCIVSTGREALQEGSNARIEFTITAQTVGRRQNRGGVMNLAAGRRAF